MNADIAWRVTEIEGRYVPSPKPVDTPVSFIHLISLQKGWLVGTSLNGAEEHAGRELSTPARRAMNADIAWRLTAIVGRYVPSPNPVLMPLSFIHLISLQNGWLVGT